MYFMKTRSVHINVLSLLIRGNKQASENLNIQGINYFFFFRIANICLMDYILGSSTRWSVVAPNYITNN